MKDLKPQALRKTQDTIKVNKSPLLWQKRWAAIYTFISHCVLCSHTQSETYSIITIATLEGIPWCTSHHHHVVSRSRVSCGFLEFWTSSRPDGFLIQLGWESLACPFSHHQVRSALKKSARCSRKDCKVIQSPASSEDPTSDLESSGFLD